MKSRVYRMDNKDTIGAHLFDLMNVARDMSKADEYLNIGEHSQLGNRYAHIGDIAVTEYLLKLWSDPDVTCTIPMRCDRYSIGESDMNSYDIGSFCISSSPIEAQVMFDDLEDARNLQLVEIEANKEKEETAKRLSAKLSLIRCGANIKVIGDNLVVDGLESDATMLLGVADVASQVEVRGVTDLNVNARLMYSSAFRSKAGGNAGGNTEGNTEGKTGGKIRADRLELAEECDFSRCSLYLGSDCSLYRCSFFGCEIYTDSKLVMINCALLNSNLHVVKGKYGAIQLRADRVGKVYEREL